MCFSAEASFAAGAVLSTVGIYSIKNAASRAQFAFASIPLLFAVQQFSEGVFWLSAEGNIASYWQAPSAMVFLIFAQVVWPFWVPLSVLLTETDNKRRKTISRLLFIGSALGIYHLYCLFVYPSGAEITERHVAYHLDFPEAMKNVSAAAYILVTIAPLFIATSSRMRILGFTIFASFIITIYLYTQHFISVWCFFAAVISGLVLWIVSERRSSHNKQQKLQTSTDF